MKTKLLIFGLFSLALLIFTGATCEKDSDGDGLSDDMEFVIGTDMNKADTDGDGYSDKEELDAGRNPLVNEEQQAAEEEPSEEEPSQPEDSRDKTYHDTDCKFSFNYPSDWAIKEKSYGGTLGGIEFNTPTMIIARMSDTTPVSESNMNKIFLNVRQAHCMETPDSVEKEEMAGDRKIKILTYFKPESEEGRTVDGWCAEVDIAGFGKDGKKGFYHFVSYYNDLEVKDVFKKIVSSFGFVD